MRSASEVKNRLREVKRKHLVQLLEDNLSTHHYNCIHNYKYEDKDGVAYLCLLGANHPDKWEGTLCDDDTISQACPYFEAKKNRADIKTEFDRAMSDPVELFNGYRDVALLLWVLGDEEVSEDVSEEVSEDVSEEGTLTGPQVKLEDVRRGNLLTRAADWVREHLLNKGG